ncbi:IS110 family transposase [Paenibacillus sp. Cedars]|uniref:IS110 family transposase n=1 Tax=Paenibacillus sp. Cedars TaxID=1980674 RepID=UPI00116456C0|nr:IS110 family transposase [Paenibacillus sp. Cedars]AWP28477.1 IS110 family transposase [Paenibacillus sp. Cedars]
MQPVVGIDVAKGVSVIQDFIGREEPYGRIEKLQHGKEGFEQLGELLGMLKHKCDDEPVVVLEATGHYHRSLVGYLKRCGWTYCIVNPLQAKRSKGTQLRKVKTDAADAWHLAEMYYRGDVKAHREWEESYTELQHLTRQHEFVTAMYVQAKLNSRALLEQVFPEFIGLFHNLYATTSLKVLERCLENKIGDVGDLIRECVGKSHSNGWIEEKTKRLKELMQGWKAQERSQSQSIALTSMVSLLLEFDKQLNHLEKQMEERAGELPEVELVKSIPGVGNKLAAAIVAELGEVSQFKDAKQLVAYAGLDPGIYSSGKFTATSNRITKRGSKRLRRALYLAVQCGIRRCANRRISEYYDKKRKEGKPYKVVVIACANKLLHHIYAILSKSEPYKA